jgi:DNA-binding response OmpR family regulator
LTAADAKGCDDSACGLDMSALGTGDAELPPTLGRVESDASFFHAESGAKALELMRVLRFDLLVTGDSLPDMTVNQLVRRVRAAWPWQKWALVANDISPQDEIAARSLGAMAVFDAPTDWRMLAELAESIRARAASAVATAMAGGAVDPLMRRNHRSKASAVSARGESAAAGARVPSGAGRRRSAG